MWWMCSKSFFSRIAPAPSAPINPPQQASWYTKSHHFLKGVDWRFSIHHFGDVQKSDFLNGALLFSVYHFWEVPKNLTINTQSEPWAGSAKRDVERTPKCTCLNCILAQWSCPLGLANCKGRLYPREYDDGNDDYNDDDTFNDNDDYEEFTF